jgi:lactam utilization protein B
MQTVTTIGLDIAKSVFQVHGHDDAGQVVIRRQLGAVYDDETCPERLRKNWCSSDAGME